MKSQRKVLLVGLVSALGVVGLAGNAQAQAVAVTPAPAPPTIVHAPPPAGQPYYAPPGTVVYPGGQPYYPPNQPPPGYAPQPQYPPSVTVASSGGVSSLSEDGNRRVRLGVSLSR